LHAGTYANDNYSAEPGLLKNIFEANVGIALNKKHSLWLDAGVFPSHLGFESAISNDNWTMTRSMSAENSPYFLTGAKLTYTASEKWEITGLILNGWQRIQRLQGNSMPSFGTQIHYKPTNSIALNWSTFTGSEFPDTLRRIRYFHNFYAQIQITEFLGLTTGIDFGVQQRSTQSSSYAYWWSPVIIAQYNIHEHWNGAFRVEYYQDKSGVVIDAGTTNGFQTTGLSLNLDYVPTPNLYCRIEGRWLKSRDNILETSKMPVNNNFILAASMAINFESLLSK
jgi:hypothetical protein